MLRLTIFLILLLSFGVSAQAQKKVQPATTKPASTDTETEKEKLKEIAAIGITYFQLKVLLRLCGVAPEHESCKGKNPSADMVELLTKASKQPEAMQAIIAIELNEYAGNKELAKSAPQASQAADEANVRYQLIIMAQNQRIIELLEQLVKKR